MLTVTLLTTLLLNGFKGWRPLCRLILLALVLSQSSFTLAGIGLQQRLDLLAERLKKAPDNPQLYLRRALIYSDKGEFKLAFADVDTAAELATPKNTHFVRGILMYRLGQFDQALQLLTSYLSVRPQDYEAIRYRARVHRDSGHQPEALQDYLRYLSLFPNAGPGDYLSAAKLIVTLADKHHDTWQRSDAIELLDQRRKQLGHAPQLQRFVIALEQEACRSEQVINRLNELHANARRSPRWHLDLAEQQLLQNQWQLANESLQQSQGLLLKRRPTAAKAEQQHRYNFLNKLLPTENNASADSASSPLTQAKVKALIVRYYPSKEEVAKYNHPKSSSNHLHADLSAEEQAINHAHDDSGLHTHQTLDGFIKIDSTKSSGYRPIWAESQRHFQQCLLSTLES